MRVSAAGHRYLLLPAIRAVKAVLTGTLYSSADQGMPLPPPGTLPQCRCTPTSTPVRHAGIDRAARFAWRVAVTAARAVARALTRTAVAVGRLAWRAGRAVVRTLAPPARALSAVIDSCAVPLLWPAAALASSAAFSRAAVQQRSLPAAGAAGVSLIVTALVVAKAARVSPTVQQRFFFVFTACQTVIHSVTKKGALQLESGVWLLAGRLNDRRQAAAAHACGSA
jgi:hypothetical protein